MSTTSTPQPANNTPLAATTVSPQAATNASSTSQSSQSAVSTQEPAKVHVWVIVLDCIILLLALLDMAYVFIDAFFWSLWFQNPKWHNWTQACMRLMYLCFVVICMLLLLCGRLNEVKSVSGATLASFGFIMVIFDIICVLVNAEYTTLGFVMAQVLLRICVLFFWTFVFMIFFYYKKRESKRFQPFPTHETIQASEESSA